MSDSHLLHTAIHLVEALDKEADQYLPNEIAEVVKLHSKLAVGAAWIPIPGADLAAGAATIWSMYVRINNKLGFSLKENVLKTVASGVATNLAGYVGMSAAGSLLKFIPGLGTIGGAVAASACQYALTLGSGYVYLKALCLLADRQGPNINFSGLGSAVKEVLKDESSIKSFMNEAKTEYKKK